MPQCGHAKADTVRVWACGDSFTYGSGATYSYRLPLASLIEDHRPTPMHAPVGRWLGTLADTYNHDGHPGFTIAGLDFATWSAAGALGAVPTDIIIQGFANDFAGGASAATILARFLDRVQVAHALFPLARIYCCKSSPCSAAYEVAHPGYLAAQVLVGAGFPIAGATTIDWSGLSASLLQADGLHPAASAADVMAVQAHSAFVAAGAFT